MMKAVTTLLALLILPVSTFAETITAKYAGPIDLASYHCQAITRSSFINRSCYDASAKSMVLLLGATYYKFCGVPADQYTFLINAPSMGRYFNSYVKGRYGC